MKKIIVIVMLFVSVMAYSQQQLNASAIIIKKNYPEQYKIFKEYAVSKYGDDYSMVLYIINKQARACIDVLGKALNGGDLMLFSNLVNQWSAHGTANKNLDNLILVLKNKGGLDLLFGMHVDWEMINYCYDKQINAKKAY